MTIQRATDRLWSGLSTDPKPDGWAPGIMLLETDTGVWWISGEKSAWMPCYPTITQYGHLMDRAAWLERDVQEKALVIEVLRTQLSAVRADVATLKKAAPR